MSSLFKQISQQAAQQRSALQEMSRPESETSENEPAMIAATSAQTSMLVQKKAPPARSSKKVAPQSDITMSQGDVVVSQNGARLDGVKLRLIIQQISKMPTNSSGLPVRMSAQEMRDIEEFVLGTLRKEGLKGYDVSIAKLMRYSLRYLFRVHQEEFVTALRDALRVEDTLSI